MATRVLGEKRGPKIGDAASLWNFTPSPGWTKGEAQILKLCLMKFGVGRWMQILDTGLLPGKLIQQLNGQTQRLLGQQSLAAYTGLQVDIDRVRIDNEARTDAQRKAGLIINTGPNLTKEVKEKMQEEAKIKYGLTAEQIREVDEQLEEVAAQQAATRGTATAGMGMDLLGCDAAALSKDDKIELLRALHARLEKLHQLEASGGQPAAGGAGPSTSDRENRDHQNVAGAVATAAAAARSAPKASTGKKGGARGGSGSTKVSGGKRSASARAAAAAAASDDDDEMWGDDDGGADIAAMDAEGAANAADLETLTAMGFSKRQAQDALDESGGNLEAAADWLMTHCV